MAEKKAPEENGQSDADDAGKKRKKLILLAGGGAVLVLVLGVLLGWLLLGGNGEDEESAEAEAEEVVAPPAHYVALGEKFTVVLPGEGKPHYLQLSVSALTHDTAVVDELNFNMPLLRDRLNSLFGRQEFDVLRTEEGKTALREQVLTTVQEIVVSALEASAANAAKAHEEESDDEPKKSGKKAKGKKSADKSGEKGHAEEDAAPAGVEQVFFTEFVLQ